MPIYTVKHNGKVYEVRGPENATPEQLQAAIGGAGAANPGAGAASAPQNVPEAQEMPSSGGTQAFLRGASKLNSLKSGLGDAGIQIAIGLRQANDAMPSPKMLLRALGVVPERDTTEEQGVLREMNEDIAADPNPGYRTTGNVAGKVLASAIPLSKVPVATTRMGQLAQGGALGGATGAALNPGVGETQQEQLISKGKQSAGDAAAGIIGTAALQGLQKTLTGMVKPSIETLRLMKEKVYPTVSQGAESKTGRFLGSLTSGIYDVSRRQNAEVMQAYLKRVAPNLDTDGMTVQEINNHLRTYFQGDLKQGGKQLGEYGEVLAGKKFTLSPKSRTQIWREAAGPKGMQPEAKDMALRAMGGTGSAMTSNNVVRMKSDKLAEYRELMQNAVDDFSNSGGVMEKQARTSLAAARKKFDQLVRDPALSPEELTRLMDIDSRYYDFLRFADAATNPGMHVKPSVNLLQKSYAKLDPQGFGSGSSQTQRELLDPASRTMGLVPRQDEARAGLAAFKRAVTPVAKGAGGAAAVSAFPAIMAPAYGLSMLSQTKQGARFMFGDYAWQKPTAEEINRLMPLIMGSSGYLTDSNGER